jgi:hypothetical protein
MRDPNEKTVDRAIEIWKRLLIKPKYDNLGPRLFDYTPEEAMPNLMATILAAKLPNNSTEEVLIKFGESLKIRLMNEMKQRGYPCAYLRVDYDPDTVLKGAAEDAGLKTQFPWKTSMHIDEKYVSVACGYQAPCIYHYPMPNDRWLMTSLHGTPEDIQKLVQLAEEGCPLFEVEG